MRFLFTFWGGKFELYPRSLISVIEFVEKDMKTLL